MNACHTFYELDCFTRSIGALCRQAIVTSKCNTSAFDTPFPDN